MCRPSRWIARFLLLVMLAPAFGPLAMARAAQPGAMHCMRQPVSGHPAQPAMQCHHAMAQSKPPQPQSSPVAASTVEASPVESSRVESSEASFQAVANCCLNHDCCCRLATVEWAQPASSLLSFLSLLIEPARPSQSTILLSTDISGQDSARAPPRS
jgi:hypothetical protein